MSRCAPRRVLDRLVALMASDFDFGGAVPSWGRSAAEYEAFFALADIPPRTRRLDCGSGPSSFAAEWGNKGRYVVAVDPIYRFAAGDVLADFDGTATRMLAGMRKARGRFKWDYYGSPEAVVQRRRAVLAAFVADFQGAPRSGRYVAGCLPELPFASESFDLVLCSHLLFLYSAEFDSAMHLAFLREMLRVGREVRVFPLLDMNGEFSAHLEDAIQTLRVSTHVELVPLSFEFRSGDSNMLRLRRYL